VSRRDHVTRDRLAPGGDEIRPRERHEGIAYRRTLHEPVERAGRDAVIDGSGMDIGSALDGMKRRTKVGRLRPGVLIRDLPELENLSSHVRGRMLISVDNIKFKRAKSALNR